ncbi:MAG: ABC transporter ATP-binding protein [Chloroflexi bacterium]|nr:ABC transporter ATP-binding protein [Chloroflexota bacterium]
MSEEASIIEAFDLRRIYKLGYREVHALRGVDLRLQSGQFIGLKGRSGSGKTTLLNCLGGLDRPTSGRVECLGQDIMKMDDKMLTNWRRKQVGFVFQSFGLIPTLSAYENVELMMRIAGVPGRERNARTVTVLGLVGLTKWIHHRPYELSGGQQQRVAIARALANKPRLLLADEPTGELDSTTGREILTLFREVVEQEKLTLLISSHDPMVDGFVDSILQLKDGQIV